jgi:hypothetical protein
VARVDCGAATPGDLLATADADQTALGTAFFCPVSSRALPLMYAWYLGVAPAWAMALVGAAFVAVLTTLSPMTSQRSDPKGSPVASGANRVLVLGLIVLPIVGFAAARFAHTAIVNRHFLPAILGIVAAAGDVLSRLKPKGLVTSREADGNSEFDISAFLHMYSKHAAASLLGRHISLTK